VSGGAPLVGTGNRISTQSTVLGWLLGLTGAFVGAFVAAQPPDEKTTLLLSLLYAPTPQAYSMAILLCAGYAIAVELLIGYRPKWLEHNAK
jgi:hypothetical protein